MSGFSRVALALVIVGALNWLLVGVFQFDLVAAIFGGSASLLARAVYTIVGLCGIYCLTLLFGGLKRADALREDLRRAA